MQLIVPDEIAEQTGCSGSELLFNLAVGLFLDGRLTLGHSALLAGLSKSVFLDELGRRGIPMPYDEQDLAADLRTLREIFPENRQK
jgi:predicted HTH domain antitoxin